MSDRIPIGILIKDKYFCFLDETNISGGSKIDTNEIDCQQYFVLINYK